MAARAGVELSPAACRIVELEGGCIEPGRPLTTRVRSCAVLPPSGPETDRRLAALRRRLVAVVVWGARGRHRQVVVSNGSYEKMRGEALDAARSAGVDTCAALADITPASTAIRGASRQPVVLALASSPDVSAALRPVVEAGARIRSVITPADALLGLARSRQAFAVPGGIDAYIALDETATCLALVRDGSLLGARELPWGYADRAGGSDAAASAVQRRADLAARLADQIAGVLSTVAEDGSAVTQVSVCGGLPELRTMTVPLMERLDVEVETLDSLFGIDAARVPEPADEFRERASELRLAWAAAADWNGPINLIRHRRRHHRRALVTRAAVVAGVAAGLGTGWAIQHGRWWPSPSPGSAASETPPPERQVRRAPPGALSPAPSSAGPAPSPAPSSSSPAPSPAPSSSSPAPSPSTLARAPVAPPPAAPAPVAPPAATRAAPAIVPSNPAIVPAAPPAPALAPVPFDAALGTILYSPDRRLAIVDGRIVGPGDEVNGARILDITPRSVLLRDARGRLRILALGPGQASPAS